MVRRMYTLRIARPFVENPDRFKSVATSWFTGGILTVNTHSRSAKQLGSEAMAVLRDDPITVSLYTEIREGMKRIVCELGELSSDGGSEVLVNAVGAVRRLDGPKQPSFGSKCAHLLAGYEQFAIREVCKAIEGLQAIIYDGFICPPQPVEQLERLIRDRSSERLGVTLDLKLKETDLSSPIPDLEREPWDF